MKIAMISRSTLFSNSGGDTVQMINTAKELQKLGVSAEIKLTTEKINYGQYDLLHFFNIIRPADILYHIEKSKSPYVVSTIFVDYSEYESKARAGWAGVISKTLSSDRQEFAKVIGRRVLNGEKIATGSYLLKGHQKSVIEILTGASALLPNSISEYKRLVKAYGVQKDFVIIPNAVDEEIFSNSGQKKDGRLVLCVSRIEGIKNQLNLIRALNGSDFRLLIIGACAANHQRYYDECKREAGSNVEFLPAMNQHELAAIYARAKVHALPSWFETTGLSSLEAAAMGCNVVISRKGDTYEYFEDEAFYCEPDDILSIRKQIEAAASSTVNGKLKEKILSAYTWSHAAVKTKMAYEAVLGRKTSLLTQEA